MPEYLSPGVYVEEFDSAAPPLEGVSTSTAGFVGMAEKGPVKGLPQLITSMADFNRTFGSYLSRKKYGENRYLAYAVEHFFLNGGSRCYVMRVAPDDAENAITPASFKIPLKAKNPGVWGDQIKIYIEPDSKASTKLKKDAESKGNTYIVENSSGFYSGDIVRIDVKAEEPVPGGAAAEAPANKEPYYRIVKTSQDNEITFDDKLEIKGTVTKISTCEFKLRIVEGGNEEIFEQCSLNDTTPSPYYILNKLSRSKLVEIDNNKWEEQLANLNPSAPAHAFALVSGKPLDDYINEYVNKKKTLSFQLSGGKDGDNLNSPDLVDPYKGSVEEGPGNKTGIKAFEDNDEVSIIAVPGIVNESVQLELVAHCENMRNRFAILDIPQDSTKDDVVMKHREKFDTTYAAVYHPWLKVYDSKEKRNIFIPPSGSMAGIYSRSDQTRGVHKAPANEVVRGVVDLSTQYNKGVQDILNPRGVNLIRSLPGQGIRVWGARTCTSNTLWKYVNVRRLFIYLEESIRRGTGWVVFEPNDERLWGRVQRTIDAFLTRVWRDGGLAGATPAEAFYIQIGRQTMTQDDIDNGKLICVIGVAPVKPAEFVIFRITQKTNDTQ